MKHIVKLTLGILLSMSSLIEAKRCEQPPQQTLEEYFAQVAERLEATRQLEQELSEQELLEQEAAQEVLSSIKTLTLFPNLSEELQSTILRSMWVLLNTYPNLLTHDIFLTDPIFSGADQILSYTPLMYALAQRNSKLAQLLADFSDPAQPTDDYANLLDFIVRMNVSDLDEEQKDTFMTAVDNILSELITPASDLLEKYNREGNTPLIRAILNPDPDTAEPLVSTLIMVLKASPDTPNAAGVAPLFIAIQAQNNKIIADLTYNDANPAITNAEGKTPSQLMSAEQKSAINELLRQMAMDAQRDSAINTPDAEASDAN